ncbi:MAG: HNH endonuclease [Microthrixaceae bacterium]
MSEPGEPSSSVVLIAERLLQVIDEGRRTATYKLALLMALIDACASNADASGRAPTTLHTREIARHVLRLYLPHARGYLAGGRTEPVQLRQITNKNSAVLGAVLRLHMVGQASGHRTFTALELHYPEEVNRCLDEVERTFARYPLRLLQVVGSEHRPFLYDIDWTESVSLASLHADGGGILRFRPGAGDEFTRLAPLLRPLIELHWVRMVASLNDLDLEGERLQAHLFGTSRVAFPPALRSGLHELQDGRCFYCGARLTSRSEVDHFIPWSRWPNDAIENLVLADGCNNHKSDHLAAANHAGGWSNRLAERSSDLETIAAEARWTSEPERTLAIGRSSYFHLPVGTPLWVVGGTFSADDPQKIAANLRPE